MFSVYVTLNLHENTGVKNINTFLRYEHYYYCYLYLPLNPLSANPIKWSNTLKQFVGKLPTNCLSVFDHFVGQVLKGLINTFFILDYQCLNFNSLNQFHKIRNKTDELIKKYYYI